MTKNREKTVKNIEKPSEMTKNRENSQKYKKTGKNVEKPGKKPSKMSKNRQK